ncbi:hypothetical protein FB565_006860 [Actinoplanes lutulentus]|uniref:GAF domain-containing protein n=1 Tax=Actinoplanes lutulentus TaxID=1287878 RepID=A0A327Z4T9_9ACTN|nr:hypothetical protein [Actinoplanes lutulentus]MBB2947092.1 hypothetical protein [Actinoplanes lutulentus]RAK30589.1 hypothetical protein B0I29_116248 [Actinoplanes lutulentus]
MNTRDDLLMTAYRVLGRSLSLDRNAVTAVQFVVPVPARTALLVLAVDQRRAQWWTARFPADPMPDRRGDAATGDLPGWIRAALTPADRSWGCVVPAARRDLPGGAEHQGHGLVVRLSCAYPCQGVLVLLRDEDQEPFPDADRSFAVEFAAAVSRAVTASLLYRDQAQIADTLRATLLPAPLPRVSGTRCGPHRRRHRSRRSDRRRGALCPR